VRLVKQNLLWIVLSVLSVGVLFVDATETAQAGSNPDLSAEAAVLIEPSTGQVLYQKKANTRLPIASTTKLMTAYVALSKASLDQSIPIGSYSAAAVEVTLGLKQGQSVKLDDLLTALLLASANDAAEFIAEGVSGSKEAFIADMNSSVKELGLKNTHFATPVGLDTPGNYSTAKDLATLAVKLRENDFFKATVNRTSAVLKSVTPERTVTNRNTLVSQYDWVTGVKTGHTKQAGYVLVASARRNGMDLVSVVLGCPSEVARNRDTLALLRYGFEGFRVEQLVKDDAKVGESEVKYYDGRQVDLVVDGSDRRVVPNTARISQRLKAPSELVGPLTAGTRIGTLELRVNREVVSEFPVKVRQNVPEASFLRRLTASVPPALIGALAAALCLFSLLLVALVVRRRKEKAKTAKR